MVGSSSAPRNSASAGSSGPSWAAHSTWAGVDLLVERVEDRRLDGPVQELVAGTCATRDEFLDRPVEAAILDPFNEQIHAGHVLCAAHGERGSRRTPSSSARSWSGPRRGWRRWARSGGGRGDVGAARHGGGPAGEVSLRSTAGDRSSIFPSGELLGTVDASHTFDTTRTGRSLPARRPRVRGRRQLRHRARGARSCARSRATGTRRPSAEDRHAHATRLDDRREWLGVTRLVGHRAASDGAGRRLAVAPARRGPPGARPRRARASPRVRSRRRRCGTSCRARSWARRPPLGEVLGSLRPTVRAQNRRAAAARDVPPVGIGSLSTNYHPQTRRADDLHLRRAPGRRRDHAPRLLASTRWSMTRTG